MSTALKRNVYKCVQPVNASSNKIKNQLLSFFKFFRIKSTILIICRREKERLIHILETDPKNSTKTRIADKSRMIKSYRRSAAGQELTKPELLRPPSILLQTLDYIFTK